MHELHVDGTVIAVMASFEVAGRVSLYQSARLTDFRWRDATTVLLFASISDACDRGFAEVDLLRGSEAYKGNFAPERRELLRLRTANAWAGQAGMRTELAARRARAAGRRSAAFSLESCYVLPARRRPAAMTDAHYPASPAVADIAVVIPAFNSGAYLDQALASVAGQTVGPSTVVVVDDCSSDDTSERARRWKDHLPLELIRLERNRAPVLPVTTLSRPPVLSCSPCWMPTICFSPTTWRPWPPPIVAAQAWSARKCSAWHPGQGLISPAKRAARPARFVSAGCLASPQLCELPYFLPGYLRIGWRILRPTLRRLEPLDPNGPGPRESDNGFSPHCGSPRCGREAIPSIRHAPLSGASTC